MGNVNLARVFREQDGVITWRKDENRVPRFCNLARLGGYEQGAGAAAKRVGNTSIQDAIKYINDNITDDLRLSGATLTWKNRNWNITSDMMNMDRSAQDLGQSDHLIIFCKGNGNRCFDWTYVESRTDVEDKTSAYLVFEANNASIVPHVANAFNHLIKLLQQQNLNSQPF